MSDSKTTDEDLKHICKLTNIKFLFLDNTSVTDQSLDEILKMKNLNLLRLSGTAITNAGFKLKKVNEKLPDCIVSGP